MPSRKRVSPPAWGSDAVFELNALPLRGLKTSDASVSSAFLVGLPLLAIGLLLLTASGLSALRVQWLAFAVPLYLHRLDLAAVGLAAIALAFLWFNLVALF